MELKENRLSIQMSAPRKSNFLVDSQNLNLKIQNETVKPLQENRKRNSSFGEVISNFNKCKGDISKLKSAIQHKKTSYNDQDFAKKILETQSFISMANKKVDSFLNMLPIRNFSLENKSRHSSNMHNLSTYNSTNINNLAENSNLNIFETEDNNFHNNTSSSSSLISPEMSEMSEISNLNQIVNLKTQKINKSNEHVNKTYQNTYTDTLERNDELLDSEYKSCNTSIQNLRCECEQDLTSTVNNVAELSFGANTDEKQEEEYSDVEISKINGNMENIQEHYKIFLNSAEKLKQLDQENKIKEQEIYISTLEESDRNLRSEIETLKSKMSLKLSGQERQVTSLQQSIKVIILYFIFL